MKNIIINHPKILHFTIHQSQHLQLRRLLLKTGLRSCSRSCFTRTIPPTSHHLAGHTVMVGHHVLVVIIVVQPEEAEVIVASFRIVQEFFLEVECGKRPLAKSEGAQQSQCECRGLGFGWLWEHISSTYLSKHTITTPVLLGITSTTKTGCLGPTSTSQSSCLRMCFAAPTPRC